MQVCQNFNEGRCSEPCPFGRSHNCSLCGKPYHGRHQCWSGQVGGKGAIKKQGNNKGSNKGKSGKGSKGKGPKAGL